MNVPMTEPKDVLAEALHDAMCDISHHDRPPARCSRWATYPNIAASVLPRLRGYALVRTPETLPGLDAVIDAVAVLFIEHAPTANVGEVRLALEAVRAAATPSPTPPEGLRALRRRLERMPDDDIAYYEHQSGETAYLRRDAVLRELDALAASPAPDPGAPEPRLCPVTLDTVTWGVMWCGLFAGHPAKGPDDGHRWFAENHPRPASPAPDPGAGLREALLAEVMTLPAFGRYKVDMEGDRAVMRDEVLAAIDRVLLTPSAEPTETA